MSESMVAGPIEAEGCAMYAARQAAIRRSLRDTFSAMWQMRAGADVPFVQESDDDVDAVGNPDLDDSDGSDDSDDSMDSDIEG